ncbi:MAG: YIP1 family protein [Bacteroides sp.]|nr:YIP1 family protein [Bacteroides sp.]
MHSDIFFSIVPGVFFNPPRAWQTVKSHPISLIRFFLVFGLPFILLGSFGRALSDQDLEAFVDRPLGILFLSHLLSNLLVLLAGPWMIARLSGTYKLVPDYSSSLKLSVVSYIPFLLSQLIAALAPVISFIALVGMGFSLVLFWSGAPVILDIPKNRLAGFTFLSFFIFLGLSLIGLYLIRLIIFAPVTV